MKRGWEAGEIGKAIQHCAIVWNQISTKRQESSKIGREPGLKCTGSGRFKTPVPPPHTLIYFPKTSKALKAKQFALV